MPKEGDFSQKRKQLVIPGIKDARLSKPKGNIYYAITKRNKRGRKTNAYYHNVIKR